MHMRRELLMDMVVHLNTIMSLEPRRNQTQTPREAVYEFIIRQMMIITPHAVSTIIVRVPTKYTYGCPIARA